MKQQTLLVMIAMIIVLLFASSASAWNSPTHMVTGAIAYRILENESPRTVSVIKTLLEKHPWYADRWRDNVEKLPESQRIETLFMLAARWADDIRMQAKLQREANGITSTFPSSRQASQKISNHWPHIRTINVQSRWRGSYT
jgi:hypothetical protein